MCGIVGYIGPKDACPILLKGLHRLEYRGYDSAGVALINNNGSLSVYKSKGKVADLESHIAGKDISGTIGVAHTRWATHGKPSDENSHPHRVGKITLVHNVIVENSTGIRDTGRVAAQIVSGIGFIGAGIIFKDGIKNVHNLTTAVLVWVLAALGCLISPDKYFKVIFISSPSCEQP